VQPQAATTDPARRVYLTPGVYRQPQPAPAPGVALVRTDVAGFVGYAERGPLPNDLQHPRGPDGGPYDPTGPEELAVCVTSWKEFVANFGGFLAGGCLAYAVRGFFANGGTTCYVVRVAAVDAEKEGDRPRTALFRLPGAVTVARLDKPALAGQGAISVVDLDKGDPVKVGDELVLQGALQGATHAPAEFCQVAGRNGNWLTLVGQLKAPHDCGATVARGADDAVTVEARSPGQWGNRLRLTVTPLTGATTYRDFALRVAVEGASDPSLPREEEYYNHLSLDDNAFSLEKRVNQFSNLIRVNPVSDNVVHLVDAPPRLPKPEDRGRDGVAAVKVGDFTGDDAAGGALPYRRGLRLLEEIDDVAILCVPDAVFSPPAEVRKPPDTPADPCKAMPKAKPVVTPADPPDPTATPPARVPSDTDTIYRAMFGQCERRRDRVAVLDPPARPSRNPTYRASESQPTEWQKAVLTWRQGYTERFAALYYPWLRVPDPLGVTGPNREVPPSGYVAGVYAATDNQYGVQQPPANVALSLATDVAEDVTALQQEELNYNGINAIRPFPNRGIRVWGARSLADPTDLAWRFIHVRRLMSMIEQSVDYSTRWAVFESNTDALRRALAHSLSVFLEGIWRRGGLQGTVPAEGFYVKCDDTNNPQAVIDAGQVVCEVGVAVAAPMEFLVFAIRQSVDGADVTEQ
jgi:hypothetical protein